MPALKEWAVTLQALSEGRQHVRFLMPRWMCRSQSSSRGGVDTSWSVLLVQAPDLL